MVDVIEEQSQIEIFDPRLNKEKNEQQKHIWSTISVNLYDQTIAQGGEVIDSPYNKRIKDYNLRRAHLPFQYTKEELELIEMAMNDKILFGNNFIELKDGEKGWVKVKLRDYQIDLLNKYSKHNFNLVKFPRQSGKTTTTIVEIVHFLTFNFDKDVVVIAQNDNVITEIMNKIKTAFSKVPFFMQPGFIKYTADEIHLDNGCRLKIGIASESVVQGYSLDFVFIDEFAYISDNKARKFWVNIYPALQNNPNSRCIIASTPNGRNLFYELWTKAIKKQNSFVTSQIDWFDVPRSIPLEEFKRKVISDIGLEGWLMGYECSFDTQLRAIIHTSVQQRLRKIQHEIEKNVEYYWSENNSPYGAEYHIKFLNQEVWKYDLRNDYFLLSLDIGEGLGEDASIIKIRHIYYDVETQQLKYKLIGVFERDDFEVQEFATNFMKFSRIFDYNKIKVVVENNNYGGEFFQTIENYILNTEDFTFFDRFIFAKFFRKSKDDYEMGIRWNKQNKNIAVKNYKKLITNEIFDDTCPNSIDELMNFGKNKNGTYAAQYGHDDLVMADVTGAYYVANPNRDKFLEDLKEKLNPKLIFQKKKEQEEQKKIDEAAQFTTKDGMKMRKKPKFVNIKKKKRGKNNDLVKIGDFYYKKSDLEK